MKEMIIIIVVVIIAFIHVAADPDFAFRELLMFWLIVIFVASLYGIYFSI